MMFDDFKYMCDYCKVVEPYDYEVGSMAKPPPGWCGACHDGAHTCSHECWEMLGLRRDHQCWSTACPWGSEAPAKYPPPLEATSKRAFQGSVAQQRRGYVYFIQSGDDGPIKVGFSYDVYRRLVALQTANPTTLRVIAWFTGTEADEHATHSRLNQHRIRGEWFTPHTDVVELARERHEGGGE